MKPICLLTIVLFGAFTLFSQSNLTESQIQEYTNLSANLAGTYQIQMIDTRALPTIPLSVFPEIQNLRDETKVNYLTLNDQCRIMIPPYSVIQDPEFIAVERVKHINSSDL